MTVSVALMCHPARARFVDALQARLPEARIVWDRRNDRIDTGSRALAAYDPTATHHVVVQDDAIVCSHFAAAVDRIVKAVPDNPISLYTGRTRPRGQMVSEGVIRAQAQRLSWLVMDELYWGVGVVLPVPLIYEMERFHRLANPRIPNYDARMSFFFTQHRLRTFYTQPSLVDHRDIWESASLIPGRTASGRIAHRFIGRRSPLDIDWGTKALYLDAHNRESVDVPGRLAVRV